MDPKTGDILGMASRPTFNPNNFASYPQEQLAKHCRLQYL
ncbi:MAG: penicillin-binding transpeptidase domain-containing protein [Bacillota bacterium]